MHAWPSHRPAVVQFVPVGPPFLPLEDIPRHLKVSRYPLHDKYIMLVARRNGAREYAHHGTAPVAGVRDEKNRRGGVLARRQSCATSVREGRTKAVPEGDGLGEVRT